MIARSIHKPGPPPLEGSPSLPYICQTVGCTAQRGSGQLMCPKCWAELPLELQREVYRSLRAWLGGRENLYSYTLAAKLAIIHVSKLHGEDVSAVETAYAIQFQKQKSLSEGDHHDLQKGS